MTLTKLSKWVVLAVCCVWLFLLACPRNSSPDSVSSSAPTQDAPADKNPTGDADDISLVLKNSKVQFTFAEEFGIYLAKAKRLSEQPLDKSATFVLEPRSLWEAEFFDPTLPCDGVSNHRIRSPENTAFAFQRTLQTLADGTASLSMQWNQVFIDANNDFDVRITFELAPEAEVGTFQIQVDTRTPDFALFKLRAPRVSIAKTAQISPDYLISSWGGGTAMQDPAYALQLTNGWTFGVPGLAVAEFWGLYHGNAPQGVFYYATQDTQGYAKEFAFHPSTDGKHTMFALENFPEDNILPGPINYQLPYQPVVGVLSGNGAWYSAAAYYRDWLLNKTNLLPVRFEDRTDFPQWFKDVDLFAMLFPGESAATANGDHTAVNTEIQNWLNYFNDCANLPDCIPGAVVFTEVASMVNGWHKNKPGLITGWFDCYPPPNQTIFDMLNQTPAGIYHVPYFNPNRLSDMDVLNSGLQQFGSRDECLNLLRVDDDDGDPATLNTFLDTSSRDVIEFLKDQVQNQLQPLGFRGIYFDAWAQKNTRREYSGSDGHPLGGGNYYYQAFQQTAQEIRALGRQTDPEFIFITEHLDQGLVNDLELVFDNRPFALATSFPFDPLTALSLFIIPVYASVYHGYQPMTVTSTTLPIIDQSIDEIMLYFWTTQWQHGLLPGISNEDVDRKPTHPITEPRTAEVYRFLKKLYRFHYLKKEFFHYGTRMQDPPLTGISTVPQGLFIFEHRYLFHEYGTDVYPSVYSSAWKDRNGKLAIALVNWTANDENFTLQFDALADYEMPVVASYQLYEEKETGRQLLDTFSSPTISLSSSITKEHIRVFTLE